METRLTVACDVVNDHPEISAALVVLPRRLRSSALAPVDEVQESHRVRVQRHDDGGVEIIMGDSPDAHPPMQAVVGQRHGWATWLMRSKARAS